MEIIAFILGVLLGISVQRTKFCMASMAKNTILRKNLGALKGIFALWIILIPSIYFFNEIGIIELYVRPIGMFSIIGGLMFGVGMGLAGSCILGMIYKCSRGLLDNWVVLLGVWIGVGSGYIIKPVLLDKIILPISIKGATLPALLGIPPTYIIIILLTITVIYLLYLNIKT